MNFSSCAFLFIFFPVAFMIFYITPIKLKKIVLLMISLIFYSLDSLKAIPILIASIMVNYFFALAIDKSSKKKLILILGIMFNVLILFSYKYSNFILSNINSVFKLNFKQINVLIPLGISFYTFQSISYLVDIYKNKTDFDKNIINFALYICFFPRVISGPIVRYEHFKESISNFTRPKFDVIYAGIKRMCLGLGKVLILSSVMGEIWNLIYDTSRVSDISILTAWFGIVCYSFYLYMNFSGYTDVAIGLGKIFGIEMPENFDYPYCADSITDFWRRWHITLSTWFKDYVYIPLGGNRKGNVYANIFIVFLLTGLWHGASWNFIFWGIYHGIFRIIEKAICKKKIYDKIPKLIKRIITYVIVLIGWVLFAVNGTKLALEYFKYMFGLHSINHVQYSFSYFGNIYNIFFLVVCIIASIPLNKYVDKKIKNKNLKEILSGMYSLLVLTVSIVFLINSSYKPFIYAQF